MRPGMIPSEMTAPAAPAQAAPSDSPIPELVKPEKWVSTHHTITIHGETIGYTATCGFLPIYDRMGKLSADMFFVGYFKDGKPGEHRPVTFAFNGGPGSSTIWLHMGALSPRRVAMQPDGNMPKPPFKVVDNQDSWLPFTDIVTLDAVGTGFSQTVAPGDQQYFNVRGDLAAFTSAIHSFLTLEKRWASPLFVLGESYGGTRVAGLSNSLFDDGIAVNGIISLSGVMAFQTLDGGKENDLPYTSYLPSETAVAWYHKRLPAKYMGSLTDTLKKSEAFAEGEYEHALFMGNGLSDKEKDAVAQKLADFTGLTKEYCLRANLRVNSGAFRAELLKDQGLSVGRYDARLIGKLGNGNAGYPDYDASDSAVTPPFTSAFHQYLTEELNFPITTPYKVMGFVGGWDESANGYSDTSDDVRQALAKNPSMQVLCCLGYFDLACPYFGMITTMRHLGEAPDLTKNIHFDYYHAGHMVYINEASRIKFAKDVEKFESDALK